MQTSDGSAYLNGLVWACVHTKMLKCDTFHLFPCAVVVGTREHVCVTGSVGDC